VKSVQESILVNCSVEDIYALYADILEWKNVLSDVLDIKVIYDDGKNQEFLMTVDRPTGAETVRSVRFCTLNERIEMFQPVPPPLLKFMRGVWFFEKMPTGTLLTATRAFELKDDVFPDLSRAEAEEKFASKLRGFLLNNLNSFKAEVEKRCVESV